MIKNKKPFHFKQFKIYQDQTAMKVGTDGVLLGAWADIKSDKDILDIGTGTGLIAIMSAQKNKKSQITGIEIEELAYKQAVENCNLCSWSNRIKIHHQSLQEFTLNPDLKFDHIITNPPFFTSDNISKNKARDIARNTDTLSQDDIIQSLEILLTFNGKLSIILPVNEGELFQEKIKQKAYHLNRLTNVKPKKEKRIERLIMEFSKEKKEFITTELIIQKEKRNDWTKEYIELTKDFYLKM